MNNYEDAIKLAMRTMRKRGDVAKLNVMGCCRSCISADSKIIWGDIDESLHDVIPVVWHYGGQGSRIYWDTDKYFYLNHSNKGADMLTKILDECGVPYDWDGSTHKCVKVFITDPIPQNDTLTN